MNPLTPSSPRPVRPSEGANEPQPGWLSDYLAPGPLRVGDIRVMCDRKPSDPADMHWPIFDESGATVAHVRDYENAKNIAHAVNHYYELLRALKRSVHHPPVHRDCMDRVIARLSEEVIANADKIEPQPETLTP